MTSKLLQKFTKAYFTNHRLYWKCRPALRSVTSIGQGCLEGWPCISIGCMHDTRWGKKVSSMHRSPWRSGDKVSTWSNPQKTKRSGRRQWLGDGGQVDVVLSDWQPVILSLGSYLFWDMQQRRLEARHQHSSPSLQLIYCTPVWESCNSSRASGHTARPPSTIEQHSNS